MRSKPLNVRFLKDLSRVALEAAGSLDDVRQQVKTLTRDAVERIVSELDLVTRDEFERVEAMAAKYRAQANDLEKRLAALEGRKKVTKPKATKTKRKGK